MKYKAGVLVIACDLPAVIDGLWKSARIACTDSIEGFDNPLPVSQKAMIYTICSSERACDFAFVVDGGNLRTN